ncbi:MAG: tRNA (adenosine(37)-N6)-threonylcarbamoyltransferase complex dimerization subunit type 1 TsaB, partial [Paracoccus sp. (in: a-proteobacteria)]
QAAAGALPPGPAPAAPAIPLAEAIARLALERRDSPAQPRPAPIYLRPADAAPPREAGLVILERE